MYLNENGKFNTFARPEDNENPLQKLGEYCGHVVNIIKIFSDENKFNNNPDNLIPICATHHNYLHSVYRVDIIDIVIKN